MQTPESQRESTGRVWRFAECEVDEMSRQLRVRGVAIEVESKPLEVLLQLLLRAGEVVTKEELLDAVWPGLMVVDGSLATAVSKLRKALGDEGAVVVTMPRVGYRLGVPVHVRSVPTAVRTSLGLKAGDAVPGRDQWKLLYSLDESGTKEVWLAEHSKTRDLRVFKFAWDGLRLAALKREVTLWRYLRESLGEKTEFVRVFEWNFDTLPFFVESEYGGVDLLKWSEEQGGPGEVPFALRLTLMMDIGRAVANAHGVGVLHKDLKPANVLVRRTGDGRWQPQVADFGSAAMLEPTRLGQMGITNLGFATVDRASGSPITGTLMYMAPEVLAGQQPTAAADVYALGVMLYQSVIGDFRAPLSPGWEAGVADPLLREDIALAASGDVSLRIASAAEFVARLETLEARRKRRGELDAAKARAMVAERRLTEARARRPWVMVAVAALVAGFAISTVLYVRAARDRDEARRQTAIATATSQFLESDLLGRTNPFRTGKAEETLKDAVLQASPAIDAKFAREPLIAARLHQAIARALDSRTSYADARLEYARAEALYKQAEGEKSENVLVVRLQHASMEARSYEKGSLTVAGELLKDADTRLAERKTVTAEMSVWLYSARGMIALVDNRVNDAARGFQAAVESAKAIAGFDQRALLTLEQRLTFCYIRLGDGAKAESLVRELIAKFTALNGANSGDVLRLRLNLSQAYMTQNKFRESIAEANALYPEFVKQLGKDHELTMQLLTTRAQSEGSLGDWSASTADDLAIHELAVAKQGPGSFFAIATLSDAALAQCRGGDGGTGESNARKAYEESVKAFGAKAGLTQGAAYTWGFCAYQQGKIDEASKLIAEIDIPLVSQLAADANWGANVWLLQAEIAASRSDMDGARTLLAKAKTAYARPDAEPYQRNAFKELEKRLGSG